MSSSTASSWSTASHRPVLIGKLVAPPVRPGTVPRPRLVRRLDDERTRLSVVVAPAGWGKTTLLADWAAQLADRRPVGWLTLDDRDDEPNRFWTYVVAALGAVVPGLGDDALVALRVPDVDPLDVALPSLINDLGTGDHRPVLVLDDYHVLTDPRIHEAVEFLLAYLPPSTHLVIAARYDPPLPLARLRARGELSEVRAADLRFGPGEAAGLVAAVGKAPAEPDTVQVIVERTEGWAVGLKLAALSIRGLPDHRRRIAALRGDDRHILDFLTSEVLDRQPAERREFLLRTAVLDRLCGPLCDAVLGRTGSAAVIAELDSADLFVVPLDGHREWYRYHRLFREALRRELDDADPAAAPELLRRAAEWHRADGQAEDAVLALIAAGDREPAGRLLLAAEDEFLADGAVATYLRLGTALGDQTVRRDPGLAISLAAAAGLTGALDRVAGLLDAAEAAIASKGPVPAGPEYPRWHSLAAATTLLRAIYGRVPPGVADIRLVQVREAVELETDPGRQGWALARYGLGGVLSGLGHYDEAVSVLAEAWQRSAVLGLPAFMRLQLAGLLAVCLNETGQRGAARRLLRDIEDDLERLERTLGDAAAGAVSFARLAEGRLALGDGRVAEARRLLTRTAELGRITNHPSLEVHVLTSLADAELADGDRRAARATLAEAQEIADGNTLFPAILDRLAAVRARVDRQASAGARREHGLVEELTDRELSILRALQGPLSQREIGRELYLSLNTVKGYTKSLYRKLGVGSRTEAVERARQLGLI